MLSNTKRLISTYSIIGFDPETGELGVAVQSKFLAAASVVPWARAELGALALQSWANTGYAEPAFKLLAEGVHPEEIKEFLIKNDPDRDLVQSRQFGIVDSKGRSATFTGTDCLNWAGGICGPNFAAQGNILVSKETVDAMAETFNSGEGDLSERLSLALAAGQKAGGDRRGMQSAGLYVAKAKGGYGGYNDRYVDIRVDDHPDPISELQRILKLWRMQFFKTKPGNIAPITGDIKDFIIKILIDEGYYTGSNKEWDTQLQEAFMTFFLTKNYEEREVESGFIDLEVLEDLKSFYK